MYYSAKGIIYLFIKTEGRQIIGCLNSLLQEKYKTLETKKRLGITKIRPNPWIMDIVYRTIIACFVLFYTFHRFLGVQLSDIRNVTISLNDPENYRVFTLPLVVFYYFMSHLSNTQSKMLGV